MSRTTTTTASLDLSDEWRRSYLKAMGLDLHVVFKETADKIASHNRHCHYHVINLLPDSDDDDDDINGDNEEEEFKQEERPPPVVVKKTAADTNKINKTKNNENSDAWMKTALQIQSNITEMATWIQTKKLSYVSVTMKEEEASLIQSTVTSFTATTANEIESLRQLLMSTTSASSTSTSTQAQSQQYKQHCSGIVQILMNRLQDEINDPFRRYQKQRNRLAVKLWQTPLQCQFMVATTKPKRMKSKRAHSTDSMDQVLGLDDDEEEKKPKEQRFLPSRPSHRLHQDFFTSYEQERYRKLPKRPTSIFSSSKTTEEASSIKTTTESIKKTAAATTTIKAQPQKTKDTSNNDDNTIIDYDAIAMGEFYAAADELHQESVLLQATLNSDLDSVQKMEHMMVDITTLLSQFAELTKEQQENVELIHDSATDAKENVQQGQNQLVDAKEQQTAGSQHYMAKAIVAMGILLLFFHWLRP